MRSLRLRVARHSNKDMWLSELTAQWFNFQRLCPAFAEALAQAGYAQAGLKLLQSTRPFGFNHVPDFLIPSLGLKGVGYE